MDPRLNQSSPKVKPTLKWRTKESQLSALNGKSSAAPTYTHPVRDAEKPTEVAATYVPAKAVMPSSWKMTTGADPAIGALNKGELKEPNTEVPSIYVGETTRSIFERSKEHWEAWRSRRTDSHILKHWTLHHGATGEPNFVMKVVAFHRTALSRQVGALY